MKEPVEVEILGQRLRLTSDDGHEHVQEVARTVDARMRTLIEAHRGVPQLQLALLVALNIGSDLAKLRDEFVEVSARLEAISEQIDARQPL